MATSEEAVAFHRMFLCTYSSYTLRHTRTNHCPWPYILFTPLPSFFQFLCLLYWAWRFRETSCSIGECIGELHREPQLFHWRQSEVEASRYGQNGCHTWAHASNMLWLHAGHLFWPCDSCRRRPPTLQWNFCKASQGYIQTGAGSRRDRMWQKQKHRPFARLFIWSDIVWYHVMLPCFLPYS